MQLCLVITLVLLVNTVCCKKKSYKHSSSNSLLPSSLEYHTEPGHLTIPVMINFDKALTDRLAREHKVTTRKKLKDISRSILKEAESYFRHPSLNKSIHLALQDTRFLKNSSVEMDENASNYLRKFCTWQGERKLKGQKWWYSILLTGLDLFYLNSKGEEMRSGTGRGYVGGICTRNKSCTILEWNPKTIGYLLAHEIGHSLGMNHDGLPHNKCRPHVNIMSAKYHPLHLPKSWSQCNRQDLRRFLSSKISSCLRNVNVEKNKWKRRH